MASRENDRVPDGYQVIYRPWIRTKDGRILYAKHYGRKAWRIVIRERKGD